MCGRAEIPSVFSFLAMQCDGDVLKWDPLQLVASLERLATSAIPTSTRTDHPESQQDARKTEDDRTLVSEIRKLEAATIPKFVKS